MVSNNTIALQVGLLRVQNILFRRAKDCSLMGVPWVATEDGRREWRKGGGGDEGKMKGMDSQKTPYKKDVPP